MLHKTICIQRKKHKFYAHLKYYIHVKQSKNEKSLGIHGITRVLVVIFIRFADQTLSVVNKNWKISITIYVSGNFYKKLIWEGLLPALSDYSIKDL